MAAVTAAHPVMDWEAEDIVESFKKFQQKCNLAFKSYFKNATAEEKVSYILLWTGERGLDLFNSWELTEVEKNDPKQIFEKFASHLEPRSNHRIKRYEFQGLMQETDETVDNFLTRLKIVAAKCRFKDIEERLVDQLIWGSAHPEVQKSLIGKDSLKLADAIDTARAFEATRTQMKSLFMQTHPQQREGRVDAIKNTIRKVQTTKTCRRCGRQHSFDDRNKCPAYGSECRACGKANHWAKMCKSGMKKTVIPVKKEDKKRIHHIKGNNNEDSDTQMLDIESIHLHEMSGEKKEGSELHTRIQIQRTIQNKPTIFNLKVKLDTGSQSNVLPLRLYRQMFPENIIKGYPKDGALETTNVTLTAYGGPMIKQLGRTKINGCHKGRNILCTFYVVDAEGPAILGLDSCRELQLISVNYEIQTKKIYKRINRDTPLENRPPVTNKAELMSMYPECFDDSVGCFGDFEYHIAIDPNCQPVVHAPRKVPLELKKKLEQELKDMERMQVIAKVTEPTDWVNSIVVKEKPNGRLRICLDPKDLNQAIKRGHYPTPTLEDITAELAGSKIFSKLDAKNGYWNVKIDDESTILTTFNTPFGRYKFLRLPFGLKVSQDVFQQKIDETYRGCKGAVGIADDIQVFGRDGKAHDLHLHEAMERTRGAGIKLNADKCIIKEKECQFFGMVYTPDGVKPNPEKVKAIAEMEHPKDKKELRSFLGLVQYMSSFIPHMSDHTANIRELLKEDVEFQWSPSHQRSFDQLKEIICREVELRYYDREKALTLQVDASNRGLGAALVQERKPIAFASKALTTAETRYANIERELLAVVYGCEKFHKFLYGRKFIVESDHRPLEHIHRKNLNKAPARLQRLLLRLQCYDFDLKYKPGKEMVLADTLSRLSPNEKYEMEDMGIKIHHLVSVTSNKLSQIREETSKDDVLQMLSQQVIQGWPERIKQIQPAIRQYWSIRDDISLENGVLLAGSRLIIPETMQKEILQKIHEGHMGMEKCKLRAKSAVYWTGIYKDIENIVATCQVCQKYRNTQQKEEMISTEVPARPWHTVGADLFTENQEWYLIVACYYSKFPFVKKVKDLRAATITSEVRALLAEQGIPEQIICDNGTQFTSQEFRKLAAEYGFVINTSSPYYPKGHGFIERQVQTAKRTLVKCRETKEDPYLALLSLRATPLRADMKSPAELLNGRRYRTTLPSKIHPPEDQEETRRRLADTQEEGRQHYNKHAQTLPELFRGQHVHIQEPRLKTWTPAKVIREAETPRSYIVETDSGNQLRRNRIHIRPTRDVMKQKALIPAKPATPIAREVSSEETTTTSTETSTQQLSGEAQQATSPTRVPATQRSTVTAKSTRWRSNILPPVRYR